MLSQIMASGSESERMSYLPVFVHLLQNRALCADSVVLLGYDNVVVAINKIKLLPAIGAVMVGCHGQEPH